MTMKNENIALAEQEVLLTTSEQGNADKKPYKTMIVYDVSINRVCRWRCLEDAFNAVIRVLEFGGEDTSIYQNASYEDKLRLVDTFHYELREPTEALEAEYQQLFGNEK